MRANKNNIQTPMISLLSNGKTRIVDAEPDMPLMWVLRDMFDVSGTKYGCGAALCGSGW